MRQHVVLPVVIVDSEGNAHISKMLQKCCGNVAETTDQQSVIMWQQVQLPVPPASVHFSAYAELYKNT